MVPTYLIWNRYLIVPLTLYGTGIIWCPHMYVWFPHMYNLMVPLTSYRTCIIWPPHVWSDGPTLSYCQWLSWFPHTLYGIGIWWSPLPYMEHISYGPWHVCMVPHMYNLMAPLPYMEQILYDYMYNKFFSGQLWKRATVCPNKIAEQDWQKVSREMTTPK